MDRRCLLALSAIDSMFSKHSQTGDAPVKRKRGRPRKQPVHETPSTAEVAPENSERIDEYDEAAPHMASFESWLQSLPPFKPSASPLKQEGHISLLSETNSEYWDCVYPSYETLPWESMYNSSPEEDDCSQSEDKQLIYLQKNFINENLGEREDASEDKESEVLSDWDDEVHYEWIDVYNCCVELDEADKMWDEVNSYITVDDCEEDERDDVEVEPVGESVHLQVSEGQTTIGAGKMKDEQLASSSVSEMPHKEHKILKQRFLCAYCDEFVPVKDVTNLPLPSSKLEEYLLCLSKGDAPLANRMKEDIGKWGQYKVCRRHAQRCPGRLRLTKNRTFLPDDVAIAKWRKRIKDDEDGKMMTFADATELGLSPMTAKRCFYCSQLCQHTVSYLCAKSKESSGFDPDIWIDGLAMGNGDVKSILRTILCPAEGSFQAASRRYLCASHFRRSSFVISDSVFRHIRLRKNEAPIGDETANNILLRRDNTVIENTVIPDKEVFLETPITIKKEVWNIDIVGELVPLSEHYYLDLPQTFADGTAVTHRFCCGPNSDEMLCIACSIVRRDLVGIMSVRTPGLDLSTQKAKRLPSIMCLWISENKTAIKKKMGKDQRKSFIKFAVAMWNDVDANTKIEFLKKRSKLSEDYRARQDDRTSAENAISKISPAGIVVRGGKLLTDVNPLQHVCVQYHSPFNEAFVTPFGYFPPELELLDYEKERRQYYDALFNKLKSRETRKRSLPMLDAEVENNTKKKKAVTIRFSSLKRSVDAIISNKKSLDLEASKSLKVFHHDHSYSRCFTASDGPSIPDVNVFPVEHLAIPFHTQTPRISNMTYESSSNDVPLCSNVNGSPIDSLRISASISALHGDVDSDLAAVDKSEKGSSGKDDVVFPKDENYPELIFGSPSECHPCIESDLSAIGSEL